MNFGTSRCRELPELLLLSPGSPAPQPYRTSISPVRARLFCAPPSSQSTSGRAPSPSALPKPPPGSAADAAGRRRALTKAACVELPGLAALGCGAGAAAFSSQRPPFPCPSPVAPLPAPGEGGEASFGVPGGARRCQEVPGSLETSPASVYPSPLALKAPRIPFPWGRRHTRAGFTAAGCYLRAPGWLSFPSRPRGTALEAAAVFALFSFQQIKPGRSRALWAPRAWRKPSCQHPEPRTSQTPSPAATQKTPPQKKKHKNKRKQ